MARFVLSKRKMLEQYGRLRPLCDELYYSSKTNYEVAALMEKLTDCGFCIHSLPELETVQDKRRVLYFAQGWTSAEIGTLFTFGVSRFVVDNERDLRVLLEHLEHANQRIELLLRMRLQERTLHTGKFYVYGMRSEQINRLVAELKDHPFITRLGIHFHRKSQNISEWMLKYELEQSLTEETLESIDLVDIGGGIPVPYKNFKAETLDVIFTRIKELRDWLQERDVHLALEPGRPIAAPAVKLVAKIVNVYNGTIVVDCSVFNTAMDTFVVHHKLLVEGEQEKGTPYTIKGISPTSEDILRYRVYLDDPSVGDELVFLNVGAYNYWTDFCKLPKLETEVVE